MVGNFLFSKTPTVTVLSDERLTEVPCRYPLGACPIRRKQIFNSASRTIEVRFAEKRGEGERPRLIRRIGPSRSDSPKNISGFPYRTLAVRFAVMPIILSIFFRVYPYFCRATPHC